MSAILPRTRIVGFQARETRFRLCPWRCAATVATVAFWALTISGCRFG